MVIDDKIRDEKLQDDINREAAEISALSSGKIDKYEFLTREEILPPDQRRVIQQAVYLFSFKKTFRKTNKEHQGRKHIDPIASQNKRLVALTNNDDY